MLRPEKYRDESIGTPLPPVSTPLLDRVLALEARSAELERLSAAERLEFRRMRWLCFFVYFVVIAVPGAVEVIAWLVSL